jgi:Carboxypeptidase regulatory-like domain
VPDMRLHESIPRKALLRITPLRTIAACLLALATSLSPVLAQAAPPLSTISGHILETSAGPPVAGAKIDLRRGDTVVATTTTATDGSFTFKNVAPRDCSLFVTARGRISPIISPTLFC